MQANGISKMKIALAMAPFIFVPTLIGGIGGYLIGTFLQPAAIDLFSTYWLIPSPLLAVSWTSLLLSVVVPFIIFMFVAFVSTLLVLHRRTIDLMKTGSEFKTN
jgi:putative ABC transport system permease protein